MPVGHIWNVEFLNANSQRKYPLFEGATGKDTSGDFEIPDDFLVDLMIPIHAGNDVDVNKFHVSQVAVMSSVIVVVFAYNGTAFASATILVADHTVNKSYTVQGSADSDFFDSIGRVTVGKLDTLLQYGGSFSFDLAGARIHTTCIRPDIRSMVGLQVRYADGSVSSLLQGDIELVQGNNIQLSVSEPSKQITISAVVDNAFEESCSTIDLLPPIRTINGIPGNNGNFTLYPGDCVEINPHESGWGLELLDTCSKPCCGCDELAALQAEMEKLALQLNTMDNFAQRLAAAQSTFQTSVLSTRQSQSQPCA